MLVSSCRLLSVPKQDGDQDQELLLIRTLPGLTPGTRKGGVIMYKSLRCPRCGKTEVSFYQLACKDNSLHLRPARTASQGLRVLHLGCNSPLEPSANYQTRQAQQGSSKDPCIFSLFSSHTCPSLPCSQELIKRQVQHLPSDHEQGQEQSPPPPRFSIATWKFVFPLSGSSAEAATGSDRSFLLR